MSDQCSSTSTCFNVLFMRVFPAIGVVPYLFVDYVILENSNHQFRHSFYFMCLSLSISDILAAVVGTAAMSNIISAINQTSDSIILFRFYGFLCRYLWYVCELHHLLIASARLFSVCFKYGKETIFDNRKYLYATLIACWISSGILNFPILTDIAPFIFDSQLGLLAFNYSIPTSSEYQHVFDFGLQPFFCALQLLFYACAAFKLHHIHRSTTIFECPQAAKLAKRRKRLEAVMLVQGFLSFLPILLVVICYHVVIFIPLDLLPLTIISDLLVIFSFLVYTGSPFVYLAFNRALRIEAFYKIRAPLVACGLIKPKQLSTIAVKRASNTGNEQLNKTKMTRKLTDRTKNTVTAAL